MKKLKLFGLLFLSIAALQFTACSEDDDTPTPVGPAPGEFVVTINGQESTTSGTSVIATLFNEIFNITSINPTTNEVITISVRTNQTGTFDLGPDNPTLSGASYNINGENAFLSVAEGGSGTITITKIDTDNKLASGTFSFVGTRELTNGDVETVTIENGAFTDVPLATEVGGGNNNNVFGADVDGVPLNPDAINALQVTFQGQTTISISAINNSTFQNIGITVPGDITPGTYDFDAFPLPGAIVGQYIQNAGGGNETSWVSIDGTITISSNNQAAGTLEGTFQFTAGDFLGQDPTTFEITNGNFSVEY